MKKYLHQLPFATDADAILTDTIDESQRGYQLYAEIESPNLEYILECLRLSYGFYIQGERVGVPACAIVDMFNAIPDEESPMREPFTMTRFRDDGKYVLSYNKEPSK